MMQPKYRIEDLHLQSDKNYTDINDTVVGFLIDKDIVVPYDVRGKLEEIINNMPSEHFAETQQVLYPSDFEVSMSVEMNTETNKIIISTYIFNADDLMLFANLPAPDFSSFRQIKRRYRIN